MIDVNIKLVGFDGTIHAYGTVKLIKIVDNHLIEHNKRLYHFEDNIRAGEIIVYKECKQPYIITEF